MQNDNIVKLDNGRIVLICGDCLDWLPKIKQPVDLVVDDPPYYKIVTSHWDNQWSTVDEYIQWCKCWLTLTHSKLKPTASLYLWNSIGRKNPTVLPKLILVLNEFDLIFQDMITWKKDRGMGNRKGWVYTREEILWYSRSNDYIWNDKHQYSTERRKRDKGMPPGEIRVSQNGYKAKSEFKRITNVWSDISEQSFDVMGTAQLANHQTPKPLAAIERIVNAHTLTPDDIVLDSFMGTGTTGVACVNLNRRFIGIEKDPTYFELSVDRIQKELANANQAY